MLAWYGRHARDLPWRSPTASPWAVLVSEVMLQQTPVSRVLPAHAAWLDRWPEPAALAAERPGEAVRAWGRLGYPRRALRLHEAATRIGVLHGGRVPDRLADLLALPGLGPYSARAVATFAFGQRHPVADTNVRRVLARFLDGVAGGRPASVRRDLRLAEPVLPAEPATAAAFSAAVMELGALVCTARAPRCPACPVRAGCAWQGAGRPPGPAGARPAQPYDGTDRQARGRLLAVLRDAAGAVPDETLAAAWPAPAQRERAVAGLLADGLAVRSADGRTGLP